MSSDLIAVACTDAFAHLFVGVCGSLLMVARWGSRFGVDGFSLLQAATARTYQGHRQGYILNDTRRYTQARSEADGEGVSGCSSEEEVRGEMRGEDRERR